MKTTLQIKGLTYLLAGVFFLNPLTVQATANPNSGQAYQLAAAEPMIVGSRQEGDDASRAVSEKPGELSDGWKYAIALFVMFFFLGIALFIQIRNEREK